MQPADVMGKIVSLCKRRGFVFQSSEIYGGLKSCYDYGPLGVELKRNIANQWWRSMVHQRDDMVGIDASIMMHSKVWEASGHLQNFVDPLVDCLNCQNRFRADKAPKIETGTAVEFRKGGKPSGEKITAPVGDGGYVCPQCSSPLLSPERMFRGMFRTVMGPVDPLQEVMESIDFEKLSRKELYQEIDTALTRSSVFLRPETAQAMFVQFLNVQQTASMKVPFGIAQHGKSFRNEIIVEHFIFRSCEFEQMEMEYFCEPGTQKEWMAYWTEARLAWHRSFANSPEKYRLRQHTSKELAHYSDDCYDIEFLYPWGWDELEGIASRTDYDLKKHAAHSGVKLSYLDQQKPDPATGKLGWRYTPYVVEPALGLTRTFLSVLVDAYREETIEGKERMYLKLHPRLAPYKAAIFPLVKKDGQPELAKKLVQAFREQDIYVTYEEQQSIGKRYAKQDEIGTPFCITIDSESLQDGCVTIRDRDTCQQERISIEHTVAYIQAKIRI